MKNCTQTMYRYLNGSYYAFLHLLLFLV